MNLLSILKVRRPVLFETALRDADTAVLRFLSDQAASLDPQRRKLVEAEVARRKAAVDASWYLVASMLSM